MPKEFGRNERVSQFIKEELSVLIQQEFPMNQYGMITLTNVDVSPDLGNATIYITALSNQSISKEVSQVESHLANESLVAELNNKKGFFRQEISHMLTSRGVPSLQFKYDVSIERAQRLTDIINSVSQNDDESSD
ncbi:MAG: 30S ribosome-binding factor RbfA [Pseudomonadota bacterium]